MFFKWSFLFLLSHKDSRFLGDPLHSNVSAQPLSHSILAWNYIQLPTPHSSRIFKTPTSNQSTLSSLSQRSSSHSPHLTAFDYNAEPLLQQVLLRRSF